MAATVTPGVQQGGDAEPGRPTDPELLAAVRARRSLLLEAIKDFESQLAAAARPRWGAAVAESLDRLVEALAEHVEGTEGAGGLYEEIRRTAPRLSFSLDRLGAEHPTIGQALDELAVVVAQGAQQRPPDPMWVDQVRREGTVALGRLVRHRQRGADLLYEAFELDLGGAG